MQPNAPRPPALVQAIAAGAQATLDPLVFGANGEQNVARTERAKSVRLPELVDRFVAFFKAGDYVSPRAWDDAQGRAQGPCVLADEDWVMLKGEGCRLDPDVVLVKPVEQYVRAVHHASNFQRFQVPHKDRQVPPEDLFSIVGPCILAHDHGNNKSDPTYTHRGRSVVNGSSTTPKFCIDSASRNVKAAVKASGRSLLPADDRFRRVAWTLVSPDPTDEPLEHVVTEPGGHQHLWHVPGVEPSKGYLPRGWAPASEVAWLLEVTLRGVAASARNEVTFFRVVFSRDFRAEEIEAGSLSLGKGGFFPRARGPQRVQTLQ